MQTASRASADKPAGINVNAIAAGPTRTLGTARMGAALDELTSSFPAGRPADPAEIAGAAVYLASEDASFVYGTTIVVEGGRVAT